MTAIAEQSAPDVYVYNTEGARVALQAYWNSRPVVLTFLRHFGCAFCRDFIIKLRTAYPQIVERGAQVVAIAQGSAPQTAHFANILRIPFPILADPNREAYQAFELIECGYINLFHTGVIREGFALATRGQLPGVSYTLQATLPGNNMSLRQMGGTFIIDQRGRIRYSYADKQVYNYPGIDQLLAALADLTQELTDIEAQ